MCIKEKEALTVILGWGAGLKGGLRGKVDEYKCISVGVSERRTQVW